MDIDTVMQEEQVKRFPLARFVEHWVLVLTFGVLVCTGLSQKFYSLDVSQWLILRLGGIDNVRLIFSIDWVISYMVFMS